jgi:Mg2+/Co2+ transporter CorB
MIAQDWFPLVIVAVLLLVSAVLSASEAAVIACSRGAMARLDKQGNARAALVDRLLASREQVLNALVLGNILMTTTASVLVTVTVAARFGDRGIVWVYAAAALVTAIALVQIVPRAAAARRPDRVALAVARAVAVIAILLGPILRLFEFLAGGLARAFGGQAESNPHADGRDDPRGKVERPRRNGNGDLPERNAAGVLDLRELEVSDVMIHRTEMVSIDIDQPAADIVKAMLSAPHTRLPLWRGSPENIVGTLRSKDVLRALKEAGGDAAKVDIAATMSPPWFVPDSTPVAEQLKAFRRRKTRFALVVDEYGTVEGLVTLDDIVGEILGDISAEHDVDIPGIRPQLDGTVHVDGSVAIRDLNRAMDWVLPDSEATTIAGLVIHEARSIPEAGQSFTFHGFRFQVLRKARNRIAALRITPVGHAPAIRRSG